MVTVGQDEEEEDEMIIGPLLFKHPLPDGEKKSLKPTAANVLLDEQDDDDEWEEEKGFEASTKLRISSSALTGESLTLGGDSGVNRSKSYRERSMSPKISTSFKAPEVN